MSLWLFPIWGQGGGRAEEKEEGRRGRSAQARAEALGPPRGAEALPCSWVLRHARGRCFWLNKADRNFTKIQICTNIPSHAISFLHILKPCVLLRDLNILTWGSHMFACEYLQLPPATCLHLGALLSPGACSPVAENTATRLGYMGGQLISSYLQICFPSPQVLQRPRQATLSWSARGEPEFP